MRRLVALAALAALVGCVQNPPPKPPPPTPPPTVFDGMLLRVDGQRLAHQDGRSFDFRGAIACCNSLDGEPEPRWPLTSLEWMDWARAIGGANFFHLRLGPWRAVGGAEEGWRDVGGAYAERDGRADLDLWNDRFWSAVAELLVGLGERGVYAEVDVNDGWGIKHCQWGDVPGYHPWAAANNIQAVDECRADVLTPRHEAWVRKVVDSTGRYGNVVYQVGNESALAPGWTKEREEAIIATIHDEEQKRGYRRHLVFSQAQKPAVIPSADGCEIHTNGGVPSPDACLGKPVLVNEYNPRPPLAAAAVASNYCAARAVGVYYWAWRHGQEEAFPDALARIKAGCGQDAGCRPPPERDRAWAVVCEARPVADVDAPSCAEMGITGDPLLGPLAAAIAALPTCGDDQIAQLEALAAELRTGFGLCAARFSDAVFARRPDGRWNEWHPVAFGPGCFVHPSNALKLVWSHGD